MSLYLCHFQVVYLPILYSDSPQMFGTSVLMCCLVLFYQHFKFSLHICFLWNVFIKFMTWMAEKITNRQKVAKLEEHLYFKRSYLGT